MGKYEYEKNITSINLFKVGLLYKIPFHKNMIPFFTKGQFFVNEFAKKENDLKCELKNVFL